MKNENQTTGTTTTEQAEEILFDLTKFKKTKYSINRGLKNDL
jgi:hypothetical protein